MVWGCQTARTGEVGGPGSPAEGGVEVEGTEVAEKGRGGTGTEREMEVKGKSWLRPADWGGLARSRSSWPESLQRVQRQTGNIRIPLYRAV